MTVVGQAFSCSDDTYILGYNRDLEEIHQSMFEVDSLIRTINVELEQAR
jgi:hypothetical protein